ncbi:NADP-dependent leukotriene B4 12-hydroxydehydrogenase [Microthyrium microscopicum]|uniref:NADP-dependent leukotriene B4 12-hydroxydehydrogenase n=1 Tax=Microthyrium microscopicum TaxID=703497 RepID=A0A6A6U089_9PEZI|nr:NADP-dependent leukotriene B4 12-hydroxydehydrogenase [Microthyrium microscopicum]
MSTYTAVHLAERPKAEILPGQTFTLKKHASPKESDLKDGEVIFQSLYLSLDPAMRGWLNDVRSYVPPVQIGEIMRGGAVGIVRASKSAKFPVGTYATGTVGWTELAVVKEKELEKTEIVKNGKVTDALGVLGMTGLTAYFGILDVGKIKAGDFVVVSGAAGATGSVVGQIAKLKGCTVLGIAGSDDKCSWLVNELGYDAALNYKDPEFAKKFRAATKQLIDVFFDNVGGEVLDLALNRAKPHARFVMCGGISQYNAKAGEAKGPTNYLMIVSMRIRMEGFIVFDYASQYAAARKELASWLADGKIKRQETVIKGGLKDADKALIGLYKGNNTGKLLVEVTSENNSKL